jgi:hypothetical protein
MPNSLAQRQLLFAPVARETPSRAARTVQNYNTIERREILPHNPPRGPTAILIQLPANILVEEGVVINRGLCEGREDVPMPDIEVSLDKEPAVATPSRAPIRSLITV